MSQADIDAKLTSGPIVTVTRYLEFDLLSEPETIFNVRLYITNYAINILEMGLELGSSEGHMIILLGEKS